MPYSRFMGISLFSISERAAARLTEIAAKDPSGAVLRVEVSGGGCSGFLYRFELGQAPQATDVVIERGAARVAVDPTSLELLAGAELDYTDELMSSHFTVRTPNATSSCGCGSSFSID